MCQLKIPRTCVRRDTPWAEAEPLKLRRIHRQRTFGLSRFWLFSGKLHTPSALFLGVFAWCVSIAKYRFRER